MKDGLETETSTENRRAVDPLIIILEETSGKKVIHVTGHLHFNKLG
jgi:hypothetical protein